MDANITDRNTPPPSNPAYNRPTPSSGKSGDGGEMPGRRRQTGQGGTALGVPIVNVNPGGVRPVPGDVAPTATPKDCTCRCEKPLEVGVCLFFFFVCVLNYG